MGGGSWAGGAGGLSMVTSSMCAMWAAGHMHKEGHTEVCQQALPQAKRYAVVHKGQVTQADGHGQTPA